MGMKSTTSSRIIHTAGDSFHQSFRRITPRSTRIASAYESSAHPPRCGSRKPGASTSDTFHAVSRETHEQRLASWARSGKPGADPVAAATVVLVRDARGGIETLMLRRNSKIAFGGMWVFPGGRVDEADRAGLASDDELGVGRRAAVREAQEEAGLALGEDVLVPFSHWKPPPITPKRFFTWFFIAPAPVGAVVIDRGEIHEHAWLGPAEALRRRDAGEIELAPPTFVTLYELARWSSVEAALAAVRTRSPEHFATRIAVTDAGPVAMWHGDSGYADGDAEKNGPRHRLEMRDAGWCYERSS
jgi:8-oxo-dGTP pyrophosphatase MutT (NUDIX family)